MRNIKNFLSNLSHNPGVYQMLGDRGEVLYIGKAKDLKKRVSSYFLSTAKDQKTLTLIKQISDIDVTVTYSEMEAVLLECNLIKKHKPRYNVLLRDDKSYPYILITIQHEFPRIDFYRGMRKKHALYFGPYPSAQSVRQTISLLQKIFQLRTCRDSFFSARIRPCLLYQINRCTGPCVGLISKDEYAKNVKLAILFLEGKSDEVIKELSQRMEQLASNLDYELAAHIRNQILRLRRIQEKQYINVGRGNVDVIGMAVKAGIICIQLLTIRNGQILDSRAYFPEVPAYSSETEIISAFISQHYLSHPSHQETIPKELILAYEPKDKDLLINVFSELSKSKINFLKPHRGEKKKWLEMAETSAQQSLNAHLISKTNLEERFAALQKAFELMKIPRRIECFDVSHTMGEATVASCVVFDQNGPVKSSYRRFNIENLTPGDDVSAMRQVISRRFKRLQKEAAPLPDIVLIDGGPTQLAAANRSLKELSIEDVLLVGVSKGPKRKAGFETLHFSNKQSQHLSSDSLALHLIQQIRDEAHRFAITGHKQRRDKTRGQSLLQTIAGVGPKRRRELLRYFGGIQALAHASLDELTKVPGISRSLAERIFAALHDAII